MLRSLLLAGAVVPGLIAAALPADAADVELSRPYAAITPVLNWTGLYVGGHLGGVDNRYDVSVAVVPNVLTDVSAAGASNTRTFDTLNFANFNKDPNRATSFIGGGQIGYNLQFGSFVLGVEGDYSGMHSRQTLTRAGTGTTVSASGVQITSGGAATGATLNTTLGIKSDWSASVRARGGIALGSWLFYATGGAAFTDVNLSSGTTISTSSGSIGTPADARSSESYAGYTVGVGGEYAFSDYVSIGVEYRYSDYGRESFTTAIVDLRPTVANTTFNTTTSVGLTSQQVTGRLNIRFGSLFGGL
jgi:outer membrane immunogenic protein